MFRKTSGAIICPRCGRLTHANAAQCLVCGQRNPGMWGLAGPLGSLARLPTYTNLITGACIALYVVSLIADPIGALRPRSIFSAFSPSDQALLAIGETGAVPVQMGRWWTPLTAIYLHGSLLHIFFNVLWIRQLGPAVEDLYGRSRMFVIFTIAGIVGFVVSNAVTIPFTVGASGSIFGLLGAMVAYGRKRGGVFGRMVLRQYGQWALILFIFGFLMSGVNNFAHAGGFFGGLAAGLLLSLAERRTERGVDQVAALTCVVATVLAFGLAVWVGFL